MIHTFYSSVTLACLLLLMLPTQRLPAHYRALLAVLLLTLIQVPIAGVALAGHWSATVGELAVTTALLLVLLANNRLRGSRPTMATGLRKYLPVVSLIALPFYAMTMGASPWDPYRLGYQPHLLLIVVLVMAMYCWYRGHLLPAILLAAATAAFSLNGLSSDNYWDYLLDPLLGMFAVAITVRKLWRVQRRRRRLAAAR